KPRRPPASRSYSSPRSLRLRPPSRARRPHRHRHRLPAGSARRTTYLRSASASTSGWAESISAGRTWPTRGSGAAGMSAGNPAPQSACAPPSSVLPTSPTVLISPRTSTPCSWSAMSLRSPTSLARPLHRVEAACGLAVP
uniref:Uncharacterized protein n=1 Tax=Triticum urartu TaxID=4572 RepID=A0A8R7QK23_TRIUA